MIVFIGSFIVVASVIGGFVMGGGHIPALLHLSELIMIAGAAVGSLVIMSPKKVLIDMARLTLLSIKGAPYNRIAYEDLLKALESMSQRHPRVVQFHLILADRYRDLGLRGASHDEYLQALGLDPNNQRAKNWLAALAKPRPGGS